VRASRAGPFAGVLGRPFPAGLVSDLANPKTAAFFPAVVPGFLPAGVPHPVGGVVLASITAGPDLLRPGLIALAAGTAARPLTARIRRPAERAAAVVLAAAGARTLTG